MERCLHMLIECSATMSLVAVALLFLAPLLAKRYSARCLYAAWMIVLLGFAIPIRPQLAAPPITVTVRPYASVPRQLAARGQGPEGGAVQTETPAAPGEAAPRALPPETGALPTPAETPTFDWRGIDWQTVLVAAWGMGAALSLFVRLVAHQRFVLAVKRWSRPVRDDRASERLEALRHEMGIRGRVTLHVCPPVDSPMLTGLLRPAILLPDENLPPRELELVLRHELTHLRHGDLWGRALLLLASAVHWFNPVLPLVSRAVAFQCEAACDEAVMKHTDDETRVYYSHTILKIIKSRAGVATALSTRYNGGYKVMKKRIARILDKKTKRLGMVIILAMAAAVLGVGMAFALATEAEEAIPVTEAPMEIVEVVWEPETLEEQLDYNEQMAETLTGRLRTLIAQYGDALPEEDSFLDVYAVRPDAVGYGRDWGDILKAFDACVDGESLAELLGNACIYVTSAAGSAALAGYTDEILKAAGYEDMPYRSYMRTSNWHIGPGEAANLIPMWQVYAGGPSEPDTEDYKTVTMTMTDAGKLDWFVVSGAEVYDEAGYTSEEEREMARAAALAFVKAHVHTVNADLDMAIVSGLSYRGEEEQYAAVWIFDYADADLSGAAMPYDAQNHAINYGTRVAVGLESGKILAVSANFNENLFVIESEAGEDWAVQMGEPYPFELDDYYVQRVIGPRIGERLLALRAQYADVLTEEEALLADHMSAIGDNAWGYLSANGDWERLLNDLTACDSAEDYRAILRGSYARINQSPAGEPTREEILVNASEMLEAIGYKDWTYRSFMYSGWNSQAGYPGYEIWVSRPDAPEGEFPIPITVDEAGKIRLIDGPSIGHYAGTESTEEPFTQAETERFCALARQIAERYIDTADDEVMDEDGIWVDDTIYLYRAEERLVRVQVPYTYALPEGETAGWYVYEMVFSLSDERLCCVMITGGDPESYYKRLNVGTV